MNNMKNAEVKRFLISFTIVISTLIVIDIFIGILGSKAMSYIPDYSDQFAKDNYTMTRMKDVDIIVIGSSRASHHYDVQILAERINNFTGNSYSIYNAGIDGNFINHNACRIESILNRYCPKYIIFELSEYELRSSDIMTSSIPQMAPYYKQIQPAKEYLDRVNCKTRILMQSSMYRFNSLPLRILNSFITPTSPNNGYEPLYGTSSPLQAAKDNDLDISQYSLQSLKQVMEKCSKLGVNLIVVSSPKYKPTDNNDILQALCNEAKIAYINLYDNEEFNSHPEYFKDAGHLNDIGAKVFSAKLSEELKAIIK